MRKTKITPEELYNVIRDIIIDLETNELDEIAAEAMKRLEIKFGYDDVKEAVDVMLAGAPMRH